MVHLIWSKDNNQTSEGRDGPKGMCLRLLECYRSLYSDSLPEMEPKQRVNRNAKNVIELTLILHVPHCLTDSARSTYDSTLVKLTSLEETTMEEELVHHDISKYVYSGVESPLTFC